MVAILITRPEPSGRRFAATIRERLGQDLRVLCAPMVEVEYLRPDLDITDDARLIFTSRHGVEGFLKLTDQRGLACFTVGDATATAAENAGLVPISAKGDARDLLTLIRTQAPRGRLIYLRGRHVASDIAGVLRAEGHDLVEGIVYDQRPLALDGEAKALFAGHEPVILPLMSPQTARILFGQLTAVNSPLLVAAISEAVVMAVPRQGVCKIEIARRPDAENVLSLLPDLLTLAKQLESGGLAQ